MDKAESKTKAELIKETKKMLAKLEKEIRETWFDKGNKKVTEEIENIKAYISDTKHFMNNRETIKAFEAIVYAWGIYESLIHLGFVKKQGPVSGAI